MAREFQDCTERLNCTVLSADSLEGNPKFPSCMAEPNDKHLFTSLIFV